MRRGGRGYGAPNQPHRPQMNIPRQLQPPMSQPQFNGGNSGGGPLMTDHLQGLKDIDMELELLKRKREIIEQQQQMLSNSYRQRNDYDESYGQARESRLNDNYADFYDEPRDSYGREDRKRVHNMPVWESGHAPPKRFSGPTRGGNSFSSRMDSAPRLEPRYSRPEPRPATKPPARRPAPPPKKVNFQPSKVSKPSAPPAPLARYEPAERKRLVAEAREHTAPKEPNDFWLVRADRPLHAKLNGRLELALGAFIKEIRLANPQYDELFRNQASMRAMKTAVRERIRNVMIGKHFTSVEQTRAEYYAKYPCRKHEYVVMQGLEAFQDKAQSGKILVVDADDPETFFKKNIQYLMHRKMEEMLKKLQMLYGTATSPRPPPHKHHMKPKVMQTDPINTDGNQDTEIKVGESDTVQTNQAENENIIEENNAQVKETADETQGAENSEPKPDGTVIENVEKPVEETPKEETPKEAEVPKELSEEEKAVNDFMLKFIDDDKYKALDKLMSNKMIHLLKIYTPEIVKIMNLDKMYRQTKHEIVGKTKAKLLGKPVSEDAANSAQGTPAKTPQKKPPVQYYVKILGKPSLPKRKAMESFFATYQPRMIKKHKTVHNLLFVGFSDKDSYDKILAADGTVIGRFTLDIKVSERNTKPNNSQNTSVATVEGDVNKADDPTDIGSDLDTQITDLLTSIRQSELETDGDIVMAEPNDKPTEEVKDLNEEAIDGDAGNAEDNNQHSDDIVQSEDVPQNNDGEIQNDTGAQNETEIQNNDVETNEQPENGDVKSGEEKAETVKEAEHAEAKDAVAELKTVAKEVPRTPTRASTRLATPSSVKTRRMSKLAE